jgi:hypothetical protein
MRNILKINKESNLIKIDEFQYLTNILTLRYNIIINFHHIQI